MESIQEGDDNGDEEGSQAEDLDRQPDIATNGHASARELSGWFV